MLIITDLFKPEVRGRVMGFVQMAFAGSQVMGIPIAMFLAPKWGWNFPFLPDRRRRIDRTRDDCFLSEAGRYALEIENRQKCDHALVAHAQAMAIP